jgi:hypothetical protein
MSSLPERRKIPRSTFLQRTDTESLCMFCFGTISANESENLAEA